MSQSCKQEETFDSAECVLVRDAARLDSLIALVQDSLGGGTRVVAVLEIGSFAKDEAVPSSDIDTHFFVQGQAVQHFNLLHGQEPPEAFCAYLSVCGGSNPAVLGWEEFNAPVGRRASATVGQNVTLAVSDVGYVTFLLNRLARYPSAEHGMLFQSNVLYDPEEFVQNRRAVLDGVVIPGLLDYYGQRVLWRLDRMSNYCGPHPADASKLAESGQVQWVAHAVRCVRDAVARQTYARTGHFTYRKREVLGFVARCHPEYAELVQRLYHWKSDAVARSCMVVAFQQDPAPFYREFGELTPWLERAVRAILDNV